jgi:hypothetical protein
MRSASAPASFFILSQMPGDHIRRLGCSLYSAFKRRARASARSATSY